jgi:hypothetical protein
MHVSSAFRTRQWAIRAIAAFFSIGLLVANAAAFAETREELPSGSPNVLKFKIITPTTWPSDFQNGDDIPVLIKRIIENNSQTRRSLFEMVDSEFRDFTFVLTKALNAWTIRIQER